MQSVERSRFRDVSTNEHRLRLRSGSVPARHVYAQSIHELHCCKRGDVLFRLLEVRRKRNKADESATSLLPSIKLGKRRRTHRLLRMSAAISVDRGDMGSLHVNKWYAGCSQRIAFARVSRSREGCEESQLQAL